MVNPENLTKYHCEFDDNWDVYKKRSKLADIYDREVNEGILYYGGPILEKIILYGNANFNMGILIFTQEYMNKNLYSRVKNFYSGVKICIFV
jgi:hypothetical protein